MHELIRKNAREVVGLLAKGEISPLELIDIAAARIAETDGAVNALPTRCYDRARDHARRLMRSRPADPPPGYLHGLPIAIKDLTEVAGVRTTHGSTVYADNVSARSDILVEKLEAMGGLVIAKSNTPEFGAGAQTFNDVFGTTANPWNTAMTCAGSSGGAAAALAAGQVWLAHGSDLGGSLRTPASFCSVVGLRPSPGRVANGPAALPFQTMGVQGPMGREVGDTALFLDAMSGRHALDPLSQPAPGVPFVAAVDKPVAPKRVAWSPDLRLMPVAREVREICGRAAHSFADLGAEVVEDCIDFGDAEDTFQVLRAMGFANGRASLLAQHRDQLKPEVVWNIEQGLKLTPADIGRAERARGALYHRTAAFFERYDLLLCPAAVAPPFSHKLRYLAELDGHAFPTYVSWIIATFAVTLTACPAISVPCGFTRDELPVGLQIVGPPRGEARLLAAAKLFESLHGLHKRVPIDPRGG
ncbi:MAG TPA: amidase family protein [Candidatus Cybelea sp.]|nr:amidase family protein [Candidatus Cybelea sp.]